MTERDGSANPLAIACTLTPDEMRTRRANLLIELSREAHSSEPTNSGWRFQFLPTSQVLALVGQVIDAERQCCRFLRFQLIVEPDLGPVWLDVSGPPGTSEFLNDLLRDPVA